jgi:hypothetical protein
MRRRSCFPLLLPMLALACALLATGCTARQSKEQYTDRLAKVLKVRTEVLAAVNEHTYTTQDAFVAARRRIDAARTELDADEPPRSMQQAHDSMVHGLRGLAALLDTLGHCAAVEAASLEQGRACRHAITQDVYDDIRNDFGEANTIYRQEGISLPGLGDEDEASGGGAGSGGGSDNLGDDPAGGDEL